MTDCAQVLVNSVKYLEASKMAIHLRPASEADLTTIVDLSTAAFPPEKDAIVRHLFPGNLHYSENVRNARIARKTVKFGLKSTIIMVAVDDASDGKIVGYAVWEVPVSSSTEDGSEGEDIKLPPLVQEGMDRAPFIELISILQDDVREQFGEKGTADVWSEFFFSPPHHSGEDRMTDLSISTRLPRRSSRVPAKRNWSDVARLGYQGSISSGAGGLSGCHTSWIAVI